MSLCNYQIVINEKRDVGEKRERERERERIEREREREAGTERDYTLQTDGM